MTSLSKLTRVSEQVLFDTGALRQIDRPQNWRSPTGARDQDERLARMRFVDVNHAVFLDISAMCAMPNAAGLQAPMINGGRPVSSLSDTRLGVRAGEL